MLADLLDEGSALAIQLATTKAGQLALATGISPRYASQCRKHGKGFIADCTRALWQLARLSRTLAWAIIEHFESTLVQSLMQTSTDDLIRRFREITDEQEHEGEMAENKAASRSHDPTIPISERLQALEEADLRKAALHRERAALSRELRRRGIDPYQ